MLKLVQKTKLNSAENGLRVRQNGGQLSKTFEEFLQNLSVVDFNDRGLDK